MDNSDFPRTPTDLQVESAEEALLRTQLEFQRGNVLKMLLDGVGFRQVLDSIVTGIEKIAEGSLCSILLLTEDGEHLTCGSAPHLESFYNDAIENMLIGQGRGSCGTAAWSGERVVVESIATHPYWEKFKEVALRAGLQSCWSQPIFDSSHRVTGTFAIYNRTPRLPDATSIRVIEHASALAAIAVERQRAQAELDKHRNHLERLVAERSATIVKLNAELSRRADEAEAANRAKSRFLASMSHEIRTPLNAVIGLSSLLHETSSDPVQTQRIERIMAAGQHLLGTIDAILDLSKIDTGKFTLEEEPLRIEAIVENVMSMMHDRAESKSVSLRSDLPRLPQNLAGDAVRLQQSLLNYVGNALKFTAQGSVSVNIRVVEETATDVLLRFEVTDTGIGIAEDVLKRLFRSFEQADGSIARTYGGSGLGLEITRRFAELMGGEAGASSVVGKGSTFWFTANLKKGAQVVAEVLDEGPAPRTILREHWAGTHVLLAEDEPINAEITQALLESVGLKVELAVTGREAVDRAVVARPDLILMDMQMPELDGLAATREIRALPALKGVPIIAMTANAFAEDREECLMAGMDGFISKPVLPKRLYAEILARLRAGSSLDLSS